MNKNGKKAIINLTTTALVTGLALTPASCVYASEENNPSTLNGETTIETMKETITKEDVSAAKEKYENSSNVLENAEEELLTANEKVDVAKNEVENAERELMDANEQVSLLVGGTENLEKFIEEKTTEISNMEKQLNNAAENLEEKQKQQEQADSDKIEAERDFEEALNTLENVRLMLAEAEIALENANEEMNEAQVAYQEIIDLRNGVICLEETDEYKELKKAQAVYAETAAKLKTANDLYEAASVKVTNAKAIFIESESSYFNAEKEYIKAKETLESIEAEKKLAEAELVDAQKNLEDALAIVESTELALEEAQEELSTVVSEVELATAENVAAIQAFSDIEAEIAELETQLSEAEEKYNLGSKGFYQWIVDTDQDVNGDAAYALEVLDMYVGSTGVQIGLDGDATNLDHVLKSLDMLEYGNELRVTDENFPGCSELYVNHSMMAIAQSNADCSGDYTQSHLHHFYVGENLAWGYDDPYEGWYFEEKEVYENPGMEGQTGHYINHMIDYYYVTGLAYSTTEDDSYGITWTQNFNLESGCKNAMTVDEYRNLLILYMDTLDVEELTKKLMDAQNRFEDAKQKLTQSKLLLQSANSNLRDSKEKLESLQNMFNEAKIQVASQSEILESKTKEVESIVAEYDLAKAENEQASSTYQIAKAEYEATKKANDEAQKELADGFSLLKQATVSEKEAANRLQDAERHVQTLTSDETLTAYEDIYEQEKAKYEQAQRILEEKTSDVGAASEALEIATEQLTIAKTTLEEKTAEVVKASEEYVFIQEQLKDTNTDLNLFMAANEKLILAKKNLSDAKSAYTEALELQRKRQKEQEAAKQAFEEAKIEYTYMLANYVEESHVPKTGDASSIAGYSTTAILALATLGVAHRKKKEFSID